ncbi:hypothetical protein SDC9_114020 [bioreactor metagenome]|uniref:TRAP transporter solute receptor, TAXI family n=1 Tax=bioreactor metagenome TaxID=1076179 RepID=A0A645BV59_9ZZZZ|nr:TAXI family TRAP transporter solute-binding subunit [Lutispora sp.]MEA4961733.1 TAXI family TRAP transporter solute-binding subunit [Lutispora sp.]HCJ58950.1 C4-dicarboxylate ABC transporter [Clostridiaceae bacterium]
MKKRILVSCLILIILTTAIAGCSKPATPPAETPPAGGGSDKALTSPVNLDLATMKMGSGWYSYGSVLSELMMKELPSGSKVNIIPESGAAANPTLVSKGKFPIGLGYNQSCSWAYNGKFIYDKPLENLRGLVGYLDTYYYAAVVSKSFGVTDLAEVKEKKLPIRVSTVPVGGMGEVVTRLVFEYYGFTYDDIISWGGKVEHNDFATIVDMFKDGQTDFFLQNITQGHASVTELSVSTDIIFLEFPEDMINSFVEKYGFSKEVLPANSYKGQTKDIVSMGLTTNIFTNTDMPDAVAYAITKAIVENPDTLHKGHVALERFTREGACDPIGLGLPLHPGAEAYYREVGLLK